MLLFYLKKVGFLIAEIFVYVVLLAVVGLIVFGLIILLPEISIETLKAASEGGKPIQEIFLSFIPQNIMFIGALWVLRKAIFIRNFSESGLVINNFAPSLLRGFGIGFLLILIGFVLLLFIGELSLLPVRWSAYLFFSYWAMFFFQSLSEEVLMRGFLLPTIAYRLGKPLAIFISSAVFSFMHFINPNFNWIGGLNIFLTGILFSFLFYRYQNIWVATGVHWGWNFVQSVVLDFNVSGHQVYSIVQFKSNPPQWLSGGDFGFEGSIVSIILLLVLILWAFREYQFSKS